MRRTAVIDLGSNSFRLVVYDWEPGGPWTLSDEIREPVRISAGMGDKSLLRKDAIERAISTAEVFASFCRASGIDDVLPVGTSAIRDAHNRDELLDLIHERTGWDVRVLSGAEEAYYGYLAVVNSTTLVDGFALDMGGGSIQLSRIEGRRLRDAESLRLGAVRVSEAFLGGDEASTKEMKKLTKHVTEQIERLGWWGGSPRLAGIGGSIRNLAAAAQKRGGYPDSGVQGFILTRETLAELVDELAQRPASKRGKVPGIKPDRGDVILGAALVLAAVMDAGGFEAIEVTEAGLREGVFFERFLDGVHPALIDDVRGQSVDNLARRYGHSGAHAKHVEHLSLELYDGLADAELVERSAEDRDLLARACTLHDIGVAVHYDDHHKHSRYLILSSGLPGFDQRELELISLIAQYHRKGDPDASPLGALARDGDQERLALLAGIIRIAEQLERGRDQTVRNLRVSSENGSVVVCATAAEDDAVAIWSARRAAELLADALGHPLAIENA
jgi:exopolyphosphatase / guanosine-5'-triphosphate,3'-diphosphate pyrophosphatase